jgi:hypothetical protein
MDKGHLNDYHGINPQTLEALIRNRYPNASPTLTPADILFYAVQHEKVTDCSLIDSVVSDDLALGNIIPGPQRVGAARLLSIERALRDREFQLKELARRNKQRERQKRNNEKLRVKRIMWETVEREKREAEEDAKKQFFDNLEEISLEAFGLTKRELYLLLKHKHKFFRGNKRFTGNDLFRRFNSDFRNLKADVRAAFRSREKDVKDAGDNSVEAVLVRLKYLLYELDHLDPHRALRAAVHGNPQLFASRDPKVGNVPENRTRFLCEIVSDSQKFRKFFMALWNSSRCQQIYWEGKAKAGDPWDEAFKW